MDGEKNSYQAEIFFNRVEKNFRRMKKFARKNGIHAFRVYDRDIPEVPLCLDVYSFAPDGKKSEIAEFYEKFAEEIAKNSAEAQKMISDEKKRTFANLYLYERPYEKDEDDEIRWLNLMKIRAAEALEISPENVVVKTRKKQHDRTEKIRVQYEKSAEKEICGTIFEQGELFFVNLNSYIDTGIFLDHRPLRKKIRGESTGKRVLNLFCYTGSFSVYAMSGGASFVESVDLSNTYIDWAKKNFALNGFTDEKKFRFRKMDALKFLDEPAEKNGDGKKFDIIVLDPPTFSNSKSTETLLDVNRDYIPLIKKCLALLSENGTLYFSTNSRRLRFDEKLLPENVRAKEITAGTIPEDFRNAKIHRVWEICRVKNY